MTKEQAIRIVDQIDIINQIKSKFSAFDILMTAARESEDKVDLTGKDIGNLFWLIRDSIIDPILKASDQIYQTVREEGIC